MIFLIALAISYNADGRENAKSTNINPVAASLGITEKNSDEIKKENSLNKIITDAKYKNDTIGELIGSYKLSGFYMDFQGKLMAAETLLTDIIKKSSSLQGRLDSILPRVYTSLADIYYRQGKFQKAISALNSVDRVLKNDHSKNVIIFILMGALWVNMPEIYQPEGYKRAIFYLEQAESIFRRENNIIYLAVVLNNEGDAYMKLKKWDVCEKKLRECIALSRKNNLKAETAVATVGEAFYLQGKFKEAQSYLEDVHRVKSDEYYYGYVTILLAKTFMGMEQYGKVGALLKEVEHIAKSQHRNDLLVDVYKVRSEFKNRQGKYKEALMLFKMYNTLRDSLLGNDAVVALQNLDVKFRTSEANRKLLERQLFIKKQGQLLQKKNLQILILILFIVIITVILLAIYNRRIHKRKLLTQNARIDLLKATVSGEEKERQRIAQELHDGIGGMLAVVNMNLQTAKKGGFKDEHHNDKILQMISTISADVRKAAHNLLPTALEEHDLLNAIKILCEEVSGNANAIMIDLEVEGDTIKVERTFNITIYRIIQELIQNILKHSGASHIVIIMESYNGNLTINVDDNGLGYNLQLVEQKCLGLKNIRTRVASLGGSMQIRSEIGIGTAVSMVFKYLT